MNTPLALPERGDADRPGRACMVLQTGQTTCHDAGGIAVPCAGTGQDGAFRTGASWPAPRFETDDGSVRDRLTGLVWTLDANPAGFPLSWREAFDYVARMNGANSFGRADWRLPNRRELRSLVSHQTRRPALPDPHPFTNVFPGWYWTSTSAAISPSHAWYVHMDGGRMFYGGKDQSFLLWPVRGLSTVLPATGQKTCFNENGMPLPCRGTGQDGELRHGLPWPEPRFEPGGQEMLDRLTGLLWRREADLSAGEVTWPEALEAVASLSRSTGSPWRLPNINELESLVDCGAHNPALPPDHRFRNLQEVYWSSTTSLFEPDWAWALYLDKGAVGVGQKALARFHVWAVSSGRQWL